MSPQLLVIGLGIGDDADSAWLLSGLAFAPPTLTLARSSQDRAATVIQHRTGAATIARSQDRALTIERDDP
jgi:hypothetical protein